MLWHPPIFFYAPSAFPSGSIVPRTFKTDVLNLTGQGSMRRWPAGAKTTGVTALAPAAVQAQGLSLSPSSLNLMGNTISADTALPSASAGIHFGIVFTTRTASRTKSALGF